MCDVRRPHRGRALSRRGDTARALAPRLGRARDEILARWQERVRELPGARDLPEPLLHDEVEALLDQLIVDLASLGDSRRWQREGSAASLHGVERLRAGFDVGEVVAEYNLLRTLVFETAAADTPLACAEIGFVNDVFDHAIGNAVESYVRQHALEERRRRAEAIAFLTHEMRTPLSAVSAVAELLRTPQPPEPHLSDVLERSIARLDGLIRELIGEAQHIRGDLLRERRPARIRLSLLVQAILFDLEPPARQAGVALAAEVPQDLDVWADPNILDIVLANLVKNAIEHSGASRIVVGASATDEQATCWIEDDGRGIPPERLRAIFEPYQTRDGRGTGRGLGLHIAQRFSHALDGTLVACASDAGARFELTLPRHAPA